MRAFKTFGVIWLVAVAIMWVASKAGFQMPPAASSAQAGGWGPSAQRTYAECRSSDPLYGKCDMLANRTNLYTGGQ